MVCRLLRGEFIEAQPSCLSIQMKILYVVSLFSGLEKSIMDRQWSPQGVPTVYKMMEALDRGEQVKFILTYKNSGRDTLRKWEERKDKEFSLRGLRNPIRVLAGAESYPAKFGRARGYLRELRQMIILWCLAQQFRPDLVYLDRANIWSASVLSRFSSIPVVLRVMGITPGMHGTIGNQRLDYRILRWAYRAPFAAVICTQDGSGGEVWLNRILRRSTPRFLLLNGVNYERMSEEPPAPLDSLPSDRMIVLFLGRLEKDKGCDEFAEAIMLLLKNHSNRIHALIVGSGNREKKLKRKINAFSAGHMFTFVSRLPHEKIRHAFAASDVYVSLNRMGNLSNSNLEAISAGLCTILPESLPEKGIDVVIDRLLSKDSVIRIPRKNVVESLAKTLEYLVENPKERNFRGRAIAVEG